MCDFEAPGYHQVRLRRRGSALDNGGETGIRIKTGFTHRGQTQGPLHWIDRLDYSSGLIARMTLNGDADLRTVAMETMLLTFTCPWPQTSAGAEIGNPADRRSPSRERIAHVTERIELKVR